VHRKRSAIVIQSAIRRQFAAITAQQMRTELELSAAASRTKSARSWLTPKLQHAAAVHIQRIARGRQGQAEWRRSRLAAVVIQCLVTRKRVAARVELRAWIQQCKTLPIGSVEDEIARTRARLTPYMSAAGPPLSKRLLQRPPFRYMRDVVLALRESTGFAEGLFDAEEASISKSTRRDVKLSFLKKLLNYCSLAIDCDLGQLTDAEHIVSGLKCSETNRLLQCMAASIASVVARARRTGTTDAGLSLFREISEQALLKQGEASP